MEIVRTEKINSATKNAKYTVECNRSVIYTPKLENARRHALEILSKHPGYWVSIFVIKDKKEVDAGGYYKMVLKQISSLHF